MLPAATALFDEATIGALGEAMAARRGVRYTES